MSATANASMHGDKTIAGAMALAMHALFIVLLIFGVSWQKKIEPPVEAELWSSLPPLPQPKIVPSPEPEPPPKPEPKVEAPPSKVEPKPVVKPEIAFKKKEVEKKKPEPPKAEPKKDDKAEKAAAEKLRLAKEKEAETKRKFEEDKKREMDLIRAEREADVKAMEARATQNKLINEYTERIKTKIRSQIIEPPGLQGSPVAEFDVVLIPGGEVLNVKLRKSSGVPAYDAAAERAIMKAQPLPLPPDPTMFSRFRELRLEIRPK